MMMWFLICLAFLLVGAGWWRFRRKPAPPWGIVLLLSRPRRLGVGTLAGILSEASRREVRPVPLTAAPAPGEPAGNMVTGDEPTFLALIENVPFLIHTVDRPYVGGKIRVSLRMPAGAIRQAMANHAAWMSIDVLHPQDATPERQQIVATAAALLLDEHCVALYHPALDRFGAMQGEAARAALRAADPITTVFAPPLDVAASPSGI